MNVGQNILVGKIRELEGEDNSSPNVVNELLDWAEYADNLDDNTINGFKERFLNATTLGEALDISREHLVEIGKNFKEKGACNMLGLQPIFTYDKMGWYLLVSEKAYIREGNYLQNCIGKKYHIDGDEDIYVLKKNIPVKGKCDSHVAIRVRKATGIVEEIKGKNNNLPVEKYHGFISDFLNMTQVIPDTFAYRLSKDKVILMVEKNMLNSDGMSQDIPPGTENIIFFNALEYFELSQDGLAIEYIWEVLRKPIKIEELILEFDMERGLTIYGRICDVTNEMINSNNENAFKYMVVASDCVIKDQGIVLAFKLAGNIPNLFVASEIINNYEDHCALIEETINRFKNEHYIAQLLSADPKASAEVFISMSKCMDIRDVYTKCFELDKLPYTMAVDKRMREIYPDWDFPAVALKMRNCSPMKFLDNFRYFSRNMGETNAIELFHRIFERYGRPLDLVTGEPLKYKINDRFRWDEIIDAMATEYFVYDSDSDVDYNFEETHIKLENAFDDQLYDRALERFNEKLKELEGSYENLYAEETRDPSDSD